MHHLTPELWQRGYILVGFKHLRFVACKDGPGFIQAPSAHIDNIRTPLLLPSSFMPTTNRSPMYECPCSVLRGLLKYDTSLSSHDEYRDILSHQKKWRLIT